MGKYFPQDPEVLCLQWEVLGAGVSGRCGLPPSPSLGPGPLRGARGGPFLHLPRSLTPCPPGPLSRCSVHLGVQCSWWALGWSGFPRWATGDPVFGRGLPQVESTISRVNLGASLTPDSVGSFHGVPSEWERVDVTRPVIPDPGKGGHSAPRMGNVLPQSCLLSASARRPLSPA